MATFEQLRNDALKLTDQVGASDAEQVAEVALSECMNYVASKVQLDDLISRVVYTITAADVANEYVPLGVGGFGVTDLETPLQMHIAMEADEGPQYLYRRWLPWLSMKSLPDDPRTHVFSRNNTDERPRYSFSIDPSDNVHIFSFPSEDRVATLYYETTPTGYGDGTTTPPIPGRYQSILTHGAVLVLKEWLREPLDNVFYPWELFSKLEDHIRELEIHLRSNGQRAKIKIHRSVRGC